MTQYIFKSDRHKAMAMSLVRELIQTGLRTIEIAKAIKKEFSVDFSKKSCEMWIKLERSKLSGDFERREAYMDKWRAEYESNQPIPSESELQLEYMFDIAKSRGLIN